MSAHNDDGEGEQSGDDEVFLDEDDIIQEIPLDEEDLPDADGDADADEPDDADDSVHIFTGHTDEIYTVACSPADASVVATGGRDDKGFLWKIGRADWGMELQGHTDSVSALAFSADGLLLASSGFDGLVQVWDVASCTRKCVLEGPGKGIEWVRWHPRGHVVLGGSEDSAVWMWNADKNAYLNVFSGHGGPVTCGDFTPDGKTICTGSDDASLRIWNPTLNQGLQSSHLSSSCFASLPTKARRTPLPPPSPAGHPSPSPSPRKPSIPIVFFLPKPSSSPLRLLFSPPLSVLSSAPAMQGGQMMVEESVRLASILVPSKPSFFTSLTKIVGTLGPKSRSIEVIEACLAAGMSVARFDFSWLDADYHQETLDNLRKAIRNVNKLCAVMMDTMGPELQVCNANGNPIVLKVDDHVTITPDLSKVPSQGILPINYAELAKAVKKGDTIFVGQYLFTGSETTSVWLEVIGTEGEDVICLVKNSATLAGFILTMHVAQVHINLPTLTDTDKQVISTWGCHNKVDIISLSYTRHAEDVQQLRAFLEAHNLPETQIFAKVESVEGLKHFDEILQEADGIILSRGNLGIDLPPEKVFLFQKSAVHKCNMAGKPAIITRVVDSMTDNLRPTRAEATDVANAVLDGTDGILLGAETLRGLYPVDAIKTVGRICAEAESVYNQSLNFKRIVKHVGEPMPHAEAVASSAVRAAIQVKAAVIVVFTTSGKAARLVSKYRPPMPVLAIVVPRLRANSFKWSFSGAIQARQCLAVRGVYPILANLNVGTSDSSGEWSALTFALDRAKSVGLVKPNDRAVVFQKIGDASVVEIIELS